MYIYNLCKILCKQLLDEESKKLEERYTELCGVKFVVYANLINYTYILEGLSVIRYST